MVVAGHRGGRFADMIRLPAMVLWAPCDGRDTEMFLAATAGGLIGIQVSILCVYGLNKAAVEVHGLGHSLHGVHGPRDALETAPRVTWTLAMSPNQTSVQS